MDDGDLGFRLHHLRGRLGLFSGGPLTGPPHDHRTVPYGDWRQAADQFIDEELKPLVAREGRRALPQKTPAGQKPGHKPPKPPQNKNSLMRRLARSTAMVASALRSVWNLSMAA